MKRALLLLFIVCCAVSALTSAEVNKRSKPSATIAPASNFDTGATTTASTTTTKSKTTTKTPTTTKSTNTTTTTTKPNTTTTMTITTKSTNTTTTTTTTTKSPKTTTTTKKPTTTTKPTTPAPPKPTPAANATVGNYSLKTKEGAKCMMAQMAVQIRLDTKVKGTFSVQPNKTKAVGICEATKVNFTLSFNEGFITFMFNKSAAENTVYVNALSFTLSYPFAFKGNTPYVAKNESVHLFAAKIGHSYSCRTESLYMGNGLYLDVTQDRMQAFNLTNNDFGFPDPCPADKPDYRVAVAVGVTLLVLIVIVVLAYLLGRRKRTDGYQSL